MTSDPRQPGARLTGTVSCRREKSVQTSHKHGHWDQICPCLSLADCRSMLIADWLLRVTPSLNLILSLAIMQKYCRKCHQYWTDPASVLKTFTKLSCVCEWHQSWKIKSIFVLYDCNCAHRLDIFSCEDAALQVLMSLCVFLTLHSLTAFDSF